MTITYYVMVLYTSSLVMHTTHISSNSFWWRHTYAVLEISR